MSKLPSSTQLVITQQALEQATTKHGLRAPTQPSPPRPHALENILGMKRATDSKIGQRYKLV